MRNVWNDSFRSMLTLLDGEAQPEQDVVRGKFLVYVPKSVYRYSALAFQPGAISVSQPAPTVLPTRVSLQLTTVVAVPTGEKAQEEDEDGGQRLPVYANDPLISSNATPPVTYSKLQGVTRMPRRARIEESDFCLTEPENWSVRRKLLPVRGMTVEDDWFNDVSAFLKDQSPSMPNTVAPGYGPLPIIQR